MTSEEKIKRARDWAYNSMPEIEWRVTRRTIQGLIELCEEDGDEFISLRLLKSIRQDMDEVRS